MLKLEIIFDESLLKEMKMIFKQSGVSNYTLVENIKGIGSSGSKFGTAAAPGRNSLLITIVNETQKNTLTRSILKFKQTSPNIGIKAIVSEVKEFI